MNPSPLSSSQITHVSRPETSPEGETATHIPFSYPPETPGQPFLNTLNETNLPNSEITSNLQKEHDRIKNNIFTKELDPGSDAEKIRDTLKHGGYLSCAFSGGIAFAISSGVSYVVTKTVGLGVAAATLTTCTVCGAIGGAGFGAWLAVKFGKELSEKHPGAAGMAVAVGWTVLGAPLAMGVFGAAGAAKGFGVGLTGAFCMAAAVGIGAFKLSLIVLEPLAQKLIADPRIEKVKAMLNVSNPDESKAEGSHFTQAELDKLSTLGLSADDMSTLTKFCKEPLSHSIDYWYNNIFSPPLHDDLKEFTHYVDWKQEEKPEAVEHKKGWDGFVALVKDTGGALKDVALSLPRLIAPSLLNDQKTEWKTGKTIKHATQTALHRITFQLFRKNMDTTAVRAFDTLTAIANHGTQSDSQEEERTSIASDDATAGAPGIHVNSGFKNGKQAWENFRQIERRYGRSKAGKMLAKEAKAIIERNYGPEPTLLETLTCGLCVKGRLQTLDKALHEVRTHNSQDWNYFTNL